MARSTSSLRSSSTRAPPGVRSDLVPRPRDQAGTPDGRVPSVRPRGPGDRPRRVRWRRRCRDRQGGRRWTATARDVLADGWRRSRTPPAVPPSPPNATSSSRTPRPASAAPWCAARRRPAGSRSPSRTGAAGTGSSPSGAGFLVDGAAVQLVRPAVAGARRGPRVRRPARSPSRPAGAGRARRAGSTSRASTTPSSSRRSGATTCASRASWSSTWAASTTCRPWSATSAPRRTAGSACWSTTSSRAARSRGSRPRCGPPHVRVLGHPYVDVWQAVRPAALGIAAWPEVPRGTPWKEGVCAGLGWPVDAARSVAPDPRRGDRLRRPRAEPAGPGRGAHRLRDGGRFASRRSQAAVRRATTGKGRVP